MFTPENLTVTESINDVIEFDVQMDLNITDEQSSAIMRYKIDSVTLTEIDEFTVVDGITDIAIETLNNGFRVRSRFRDLFDRQFKFIIAFDRSPVLWEYRDLLEPVLVADGSNIVKIETRSLLPFKLGDTITIGESIADIYTAKNVPSGAQIVASAQRDRIINDTTEKNKAAGQWTIVGIDNYTPGLNYSNFYIRTGQPIASGRYSLSQDSYNVYRVVNRARHIIHLDDRIFVEPYTGVYTVGSPARQRDLTFNVTISPDTLVSVDPLRGSPTTWESITSSWQLTLQSSDDVTNQFLTTSVEAGIAARQNSINNQNIP